MGVLRSEPRVRLPPPLAKLGPTPTYATLDGAGGANGRTTDSVATDVSATMLDGVVHVFYRDDTTQDLRHAWFDGSTWTFETLDGDSTLDGRTTRDVGGRSLGLVYRGRLNVFYADDTRGDIRRAVFDGSVWHYSVLDGNSTTGGRTTDTVGVGDPRRRLGFPPARPVHDGSGRPARGRDRPRSLGHVRDAVESRRRLAGHVEGLRHRGADRVRRRDLLLQRRRHPRRGVERFDVVGRSSRCRRSS